ncbi:MAG: DUF2147 domain-containing protein [Thermoanaerobaculia bacterium]
MKKLALLLLLAAPLPAAADPDAIVGLWRTDPTDKGYAHVEVTVQDGLYEGRIVWLSEPDFPPGDPQAGRPKVDRLNPDPELRGQPILGLSLMSGFRYADGVWKGGRIYDPETGKTYKCTVRLGNEGNLKVRGYVGISWLGRTTAWVRVSS